MQSLGRISYSWHLWHWPVLVFGEHLFGDPSFAWTAPAILASLGLATLSFRWVENPIRHSLYLRHLNRRSLAGAGILTVVSVSIAGAWWTAAQIADEQSRAILAAKSDLPIIYKKKDCHAAYEVREAIGCTFGEEGADFKVVLVGDSHAGSWFPPLHAIALERSWQLTSLTKSACPMVDVEVAPGDMGRKYDECTTWRRNVIERVRALEPDLVVVGTATYLYTRDGPGKVDTAEWVARSERTLHDLSQTSKGVIVLRDVPHLGFDGPTCLSAERWRPGKPTSCVASMAPAFGGDRYELEAAATRHLQNVRFVDLSATFCRDGDCPAVIDGTIAYRDSNHLTAPFALGLKPILESAVSGEFAWR